MTEPAPKPVVNDQKQPKHRNSKFTEDEIRLVANQMARTGCTESYAVQCLGKRPDCWFNMKHKGGWLGKFNDILTRAREQIIEGFIDKAESVGAKDWRMWNERLKHVAPERFSDKPQSLTTQDNPMLGLIMDKAIRMALAERKAQQTQVIDVKEVPQIESPKTEPN